MKDIRLVKNKQTGIQRDFAFVEFYNIEVLKLQIIYLVLVVVAWCHIPKTKLAFQFNTKMKSYKITLKYKKYKDA